MVAEENIVPVGPFSLRAAASFGFGPTEGTDLHWDGAMRLAFALDGGRGYVGAVLAQPAAGGAGSDGPGSDGPGSDGPGSDGPGFDGPGFDGPGFDGPGFDATLSDGPGATVSVRLELDATDDVAAALAQIARVVSLDGDGAAFSRLGRRDPVLGALQRAHPGQRPVLFCSPYEAAAWAVLSARRPAAQGARIRDALGSELGTTFSLDGSSLSAFPQPSRLAELPDGFPELNATKVQRLRGVAAAALAGDLDVTRLRSLGPEVAYEAVQQIDGIGPFYASLIVLRATGFADAWLGPAPAAHRGEDPVTRFYGPLDADDLASVVDGWRPFRTWALVLTRLAAMRGTRINV